MTMRRATAVLVVLGLVAGLGYWLGTRWERTPPFGPRPGCQAEADGRVRLAVEQMANAATITAVGVRMELPDRAVQVALATALQESKLRNLPHLGDSNDHDSVGLFQQRPSQGWGTGEQLREPRYAAERFYRALARVPGWQELRLTEAAQRVQRSAYPEAYARWEPDARVLASALLGDQPGAVSCTVGDDPPARGEAAAAALGEALAADWGAQVRTSPAGGEPAGALRLVAAAASGRSMERAGEVGGEARGQAAAPDNIASAPAVTVTADDPRTGWQYAHWLVAYAAERGIRRVHFEKLAWTAADGEWAPAGGHADQVRAELAAG